MSITVDELVQIPQLRISVLAGSGGLSRTLSWAHVCELPDPAEWLNGGELVLSVGLALSERPAEQVAYIERLHRADAGAVAFGDTAYAKELAPEAIAAADRLKFPVLWVAYEVPYIAVARAVIDKSRREEQLRLHRLQLAYEAVRTSAERGDGPEVLLSRLAQVADCALHVLELPYGNLLLGPSPPPAGVSEALVGQASGRPSLPAVMRLDTEENPVVVVPVQASQMAALAAVVGDRKPDIPLLQHIATIVAVELEKRFGERERQRRLGAELFAKLIDQRIEAAAAEQGMSDLGLGEEPRVVLAWRPTRDPDGDGALHQRLAARAVPHLLLRRDIHYALVPADEQSLALTLEELSQTGAVGLSASLGRPTRCPEAAREARLALETAIADQVRSFTYGDGRSATPFLPRSVSDAESVVHTLLGPLGRYDSENGTQLLESLRAFLENNRRWARTAKQLHIHTQTLHYRMRRVEQLSGRRLDSTSDVAALWFALEAEAMLKLSDDRSATDSRA